MQYKSTCLSLPIYVFLQVGEGHTVGLFLHQAHQTLRRDVAGGALVGVHLPVDGVPPPRARGRGRGLGSAHLARQPGARLPGPQRLGQLHVRGVLVHRHARHRRVRRRARREPRRDGVRHLLHALQHRPHLIHHRQHDQPRRPRRHQHLRDEGRGAARLGVREREPAAAGAESADDGERAAQVQHRGGDPAAAAVRPARGAQVPGRAPPLQGLGPALLPVSGSLQRPRPAAGT